MAPVLVFVGMIIGQPMDLIFSPLELIAIVLAVYVTRNLIYDGESSWLEGLILVGVYSCSASRSCTTPGPIRPTRWPRPRRPRPARDRLRAASKRRSAASLAGNLMLRWLEFVVGLLVWLGVIWDGFATIVLPRPWRR